MPKRGNNEGSLYKRADGRWAGAVTVDGGRRKYAYGRTRADVQARLVKLQREQQLGMPVVDERETVGHFLDRWLEDSVKRSVRPKTHTNYAQYVENWIKPALGRERLAKLSPQQVEKLMDKMLTAGLSPRTAQHAHAVLRRALGQAEKWGMVGRNVAKLAQPPRQKKPEAVWLDDQQARKLLEVARTPGTGRGKSKDHGNRFEALYTVALMLGLRKGELLGLRWSDVDPAKRTLRVNVALQRVDGKLILVEPKSARSRRTIPLPEGVAEALRRQRAQQLAERMKAGPAWEEHDLVFATKLGRPVEQRNLHRNFHELLDQAGLPRVRFHDLRHSCATVLLAQGVPARVVMEILGHSQISLTMNTYSHVMPTLTRDAADRMDAVFAPLTGKTAAGTGA
jgi:integrase